MKQHQIHFGRKFYLDEKAGYWLSTHKPRVRAHQWIWISTYGAIPKGYHIHHINGDKSDNRIENLEIVHASRHLRDHVNNPERKKKAREWMKKIQPLSIKWHSTPEGRKLHRKARLETLQKKPTLKVICAECGIEVETKISARKFCGRYCRMKQNKRIFNERHAKVKI